MLAPLRLLQRTQRVVASRAVTGTVTRSAVRHQAPTFAVRALSAEAAPSAFDVIVQLTFVDPNGARRQVPAYVGKTLHETCDMHGIDIGPAVRAGDSEIARSERWIEPTFGEGPAAGFDHVILHGKGSETANHRTEREMSLLSEYWDDDEVFDESRLACMVTVTKAMDGMIVYVPDRIVCDIP
ncbi:expressed unknown protein [Seminavis robusta]|uniref:Uncharacterized protein n=1 Tax=Seminavis robusta TaxID=568900 RepID=A0A9N8EYU9_9STRA|nr:expressed unknown protein [Seminavis robusta]|eukprot:Sro2146_g316410.1 n/a (183) ;mRNA; f:6011-6708